MSGSIDSLLLKEEFSHSELVTLLNAQGEDKTKLFARAAEIKKQYIGNKVYFRGLVELSNICSKNSMVITVQKLRGNDFNPCFSGWEEFSIVKIYALFL